MWNTACSEALWAGQLVFEEAKYPYACDERKNKRKQTDKWVKTVGFISE